MVIAWPFLSSRWGFKRRDDEFHGETVFHDLGAGKASCPLWRRGHVSYRLAPASDSLPTANTQSLPQSLCLVGAAKGAPLTDRVCKSAKGPRLLLKYSQI